MEEEIFINQEASMKEIEKDIKELTEPEITNREANLISAALQAGATRNSLKSALLTGKLRNPQNIEEAEKIIAVISSELKKGHPNWIPIEEANKVSKLVEDIDLQSFFIEIEEETERMLENDSRTTALSHINHKFDIWCAEKTPEMAIQLISLIIKYYYQ